MPTPTELFLQEPAQQSAPQPVQQPTRQISRNEVLMRSLAESRPEVFSANPYANQTVGNFDASSTAAAVISGTTDTLDETAKDVVNMPLEELKMKYSNAAEMKANYNKAVQDLVNNATRTRNGFDATVDTVASGLQGLNTVTDAAAGVAGFLGMNSLEEGFNAIHQGIDSGLNSIKSDAIKARDQAAQQIKAAKDIQADMEYEKDITNGESGLVANFRNIAKKAANMFEYAGSDIAGTAANMTGQLYSGGLFAKAGLGAAKLATKFSPKLQNFLGKTANISDPAKAMYSQIPYSAALGYKGQEEDMANIINSAPIEALQDIPEFQNYVQAALANGASEEEAVNQAREALIANGREVFSFQGLANRFSGLAQGFIDGTIDRFNPGALKFSRSGIPLSKKYGLVSTALKESGTETAQSLAEQFIQNDVARATYDPERNLSEGFGEQAAMGALAGLGVFGSVPVNASIGAAKILKPSNIKNTFSKVNEQSQEEPSEQASPSFAEQNQTYVNAVKQTKDGLNTFKQTLDAGEDLHLDPEDKETVNKTVQAFSDENISSIEQAMDNYAGHLQANTQDSEEGKQSLINILNKLNDIDTTVQNYSNVTSKVASRNQGRDPKTIAPFRDIAVGIQVARDTWLSNFEENDKEAITNTVKQSIQNIYDNAEGSKTDVTLINALSASGSFQEILGNEVFSKLQNDIAKLKPQTSNEDRATAQKAAKAAETLYAAAIKPQQYLPKTVPFALQNMAAMQYKHLAKQYEIVDTYIKEMQSKGSNEKDTRKFIRVLEQTAKQDASPNVYAHTSDINNAYKTLVSSKASASDKAEASRKLVTKLGILRNFILTKYIKQQAMNKARNEYANKQQSKQYKYTIPTWVSDEIHEENTYTTYYSNAPASKAMAAFIDNDIENFSIENFNNLIDALTARDITVEAGGQRVDLNRLRFNDMTEEYTYEDAPEGTKGGKYALGGTFAYSAATKELMNSLWTKDKSSSTGSNNTNTQTNTSNTNTGNQGNVSNTVTTSSIEAGKQELRSLLDNAPSNANWQTALRNLIENLIKKQQLPTIGKSLGEIILPADTTLNDIRKIFGIKDYDYDYGDKPVYPVVVTKPSGEYAIKVNFSYSPRAAYVHYNAVPQNKASSINELVINENQALTLLENQTQNKKSASNAPFSAKSSHVQKGTSLTSPFYTILKEYAKSGSTVANIQPASVPAENQASNTQPTRQIRMQPLAPEAIPTVSAESNTPSEPVDEQSIPTASTQQDTNEDFVNAPLGSEDTIKEEAETPDISTTLEESENRGVNQEVKAERIGSTLEEGPLKTALTGFIDTTLEGKTSKVTDTPKSPFISERSINPRTILTNNYVAKSNEKIDTSNSIAQPQQDLKKLENVKDSSFNITFTPTEEVNSIAEPLNSIVSFKSDIANLDIIECQEDSAQYLAANRLYSQNSFARKIVKLVLQQILSNSDTPVAVPENLDKKGQETLLQGATPLQIIQALNGEGNTLKEDIITKFTAALAEAIQRTIYSQEDENDPEAIFEYTGNVLVNGIPVNFDNKQEKNLAINKTLVALPSTNKFFDNLRKELVKTFGLVPKNTSEISLDDHNDLANTLTKAFAENLCNTFPQTFKVVKVEPGEKNNKTYYSKICIKQNDFVNQFLDIASSPRVIDLAANRLEKATYIVTNNEEVLDDAIKQYSNHMANSNESLQPEQKEYVKAFAKVPYVRNYSFINILGRLGLKGVQSLLGSPDVLDSSMIMSDSARKAQEGKNKMLELSYNTITDILNTMEQAKNYVVHFLQTTTRMNRVQGNNNVITHKLVREAFGQNIIYNCSDKDTQNVLIASFIQGFGGKLTNEAKYTSGLDRMFKIINALRNNKALCDKVLNLISLEPDENIDALETMTELLNTVVQAGFAEEDVYSALGLKCAIDTVRMINAIDTGNALEYFHAYIELDGVTNGTINSVANFGDLLKSHGILAKGYIVLNNKDFASSQDVLRDANTFFDEGSNDIYETVAAESRKSVLEEAQEPIENKAKYTHRKVIREQLKSAGLKDYNHTNKIFDILDKMQGQSINQNTVLVVPGYPNVSFKQYPQLLDYINPASRELYKKEARNLFYSYLHFFLNLDLQDEFGNSLALDNDEDFDKVAQLNIIRQDVKMIATVTQYFAGEMSATMHLIKGIGKYLDNINEFHSMILRAPNYLVKNFDKYKKYLPEKLVNWIQKNAYSIIYNTYNGQEYIKKNWYNQVYKNKNGTNNFKAQQLLLITMYLHSQAYSKSPDTYWFKQLGLENLFTEEGYFNKATKQLHKALEGLAAAHGIPLEDLPSILPANSEYSVKITDNLKRYTKSMIGGVMQNKAADLSQKVIEKSATPIINELNLLNSLASLYTLQQYQGDLTEKEYNELLRTLNKNFGLNVYSIERDTEGRPISKCSLTSMEPVNRQGTSLRPKTTDDAWSFPTARKLPGSLGVSPVPLLNIGFGDGNVIQKIMTTLSRYPALEPIARTLTAIFDGINILPHMVQQVGTFINMVMFDNIVKSNTSESVLNALKKFTKNGLTEKLEECAKFIKQGTFANNNIAIYSIFRDIFSALASIPSNEINATKLANMLGITVTNNEINNASHPLAVFFTYGKNKEGNNEFKFNLHTGVDMKNVLADYKDLTTKLSENQVDVLQTFLKETLPVHLDQVIKQFEDDARRINQQHLAMLCSDVLIDHMGGSGKGYKHNAQKVTYYTEEGKHGNQVQIVPKENTIEVTITDTSSGEQIEFYSYPRNVDPSEYSTNPLYKSLFANNAAALDETSENYKELVEASPILKTLSIINKYPPVDTEVRKIINAYAPLAKKGEEFKYADTRKVIDDLKVHSENDFIKAPTKATTKQKEMLQATSDTYGNQGNIALKQIEKLDQSPGSEEPEESTVKELFSGSILPILEDKMKTLFKDWDTSSLKEFAKKITIVPVEDPKKDLPEEQYTNYMSHKRKVAGQYTNGDIVLYVDAENPDMNTAANILAHEYIHAFASEKISAMLENKADEHSKACFGALKKIHKRLQENFGESFNNPITKEIEEINGIQLINGYLAENNLPAIPEELNSETDWQEFIATVASIPDNIEKLKDKGFYEKQQTFLSNLLNKAKDFILRLFGIRKDAPLDVRQEILAIVASLPSSIAEEKLRTNTLYAGKAQSETEPVYANIIASTGSTLYNKDFHQKVMELVARQGLSTAPDPVLREADTYLTEAQKNDFVFSDEDRAAFATLYAILQDAFTTTDINKVKRGQKSDLASQAAVIIDDLDFKNLSSNQSEAMRMYQYILSLNNSPKDFAALLAMSITNSDFRYATKKLLPLADKSKLQGFDATIHKLYNAAKAKIIKSVNNNVYSHILYTLNNLYVDKETYDLLSKGKESKWDFISTGINHLSDKLTQLYDKDNLNPMPKAQVFDQALSHVATSAQVAAGNGIIADTMSDIAGTIQKQLNKVFAQIKKSKVESERQREQLKKAIIGSFNNALKTPLTPSQHRVIKDVFFKTDLVSLRSNNYAEYLKDTNSLLNRISQVESSLGEQALIDKALQTSDYLINGKVGSGLCRNALAVVYQNRIEAQTSKNKTPIDLQSIQSEVALVDELITLYSLRQLSANDPKILSQASHIYTENKEAIDNLASTYRQHNAETHERASLDSRLNAIKGYIPRNTKSDTQIVIAPKSSDLGYLGWIKVGTYHPAKGENNKEPLFIYKSSFGSKPVFYQGGIQNITDMNQGVHSQTGRTIGASFINKTLTPSEAEGLIPIYDMFGRISCYERNIPQEIFDMHLPQEYDVAKAVASMVGKGKEFLASRELNKKLIEAIHNIPPKSSPMLGAVDIMNYKGDDPVIKDAIKRIPDAFWNLVKEEGYSELKVPSILLNDVIGYEEAYLGSFITGNTRMPKLIQQTVNTVLKSVLGEKGMRYFLNAEKSLKTVVGMTKQAIVIRSAVVPIKNLGANICQLAFMGVPLSKITSGMPRVMKDLDKYSKYLNRVAKIDADLSRDNITADERERLTKQKKAYIKAGNMLSIAPLLKAGEFSSIANVGAMEAQSGGDNPISEAFHKLMDKLPHTPREIIRQALVMEDTTVYQLLKALAQYGDFAGKAILYDHLMEKQAKKMSKLQNKSYKDILEALYNNPQYAEYRESILAEVRDAFVNYDKLPGRVRGALETHGLLWFWNFKLRMAKVALKMLWNNPLSSAIMLALDYKQINLPTPLNDSIIGGLGKGTLPYSTGPDMLSGIFQNPYINLCEWLF